MTEETSLTLKTSAGSIPYALRRSGRRRTIELSVPSSTAVRVIAPRFVPLETIERFIHSRSDWIIKRIQEKRSEEERIGHKKYETGHDFLFLGQNYPLIVEKKDYLMTRVSFSGDKWEVRANAATTEKMIKNKLVQWYRKQAGEVLGGRVFHYSRVMGLEPQKITVKTQKRLWGSCNHHGRSINLNWTLIMAPLSVIDYVVVHELCHLEVPNHSQRFWRKVAKFMPDYKKSEEWLKHNAALMRLP